MAKNWGTGGNFRPPNPEIIMINPQRNLKAVRYITPANITFGVMSGKNL
jgi:hypothetical protein